MYLLISYVQFIGYCYRPPAEYLKVKTNIREEKVLTKGSSKRWLQAGGARAPGGLSRSRQCAGRSCRSSPRTPAAARRSHSPCPLCAGSGVDKRPTLSCCAVRGTRQGQGHRAAAARGQPQSSSEHTLQTLTAALSPQTADPTCPLSLREEARRLPCAQRVSGSTGAPPASCH